MSANFEDLGFAKVFRDWARQEIREQIAKVTPPRRNARVTEILPDIRRAKVVYVGDPSDNEVSVPYNSIVPAYVGQYVQIDGPAGDRSISGVIGAPSHESRLDSIDQTNPPGPFTPASGVTETFPMMLRPLKPTGSGFSHQLAGEYPLIMPLTVSHSGDYEAIFTSLAAPVAVGTASTKIDAGIYAYRVDVPEVAPPPGEVAEGHDLILLDQALTSLDGEEVDTLLFPLNTPLHLERGQRVAVVIIARYGGEGATRPQVATLEHSGVPMLATPPYTMATGKRRYAEMPSTILHTDLLTMTTRTGYAGLLH